MKLHAFNFTCDRDQDLSILMTSTLMRNCTELVDLKIFNTDHNNNYKGYENGAGWQASMLKLNAMRLMMPDDDDFILSVDSDVIFCSPDVFKHIDTNYGIIGIEHQQPWNTIYGPWGHMSGCLIFIRGDIAKKMCSLTNKQLD